MLYIGLMSGTSLDGVDVVIVNFATEPPELIASQYSPYSAEIRERIAALCIEGKDELKRLGELDVILGQTFARMINDLLRHHGFSAQEICAIGSHGQTIRHSPNSAYRFSIQVGDPNIIAAETQITTVADFRRKDIALGGQGAPLVPSFHEYILACSHSNRAIVNIGGIANVTLISKTDKEIIGFDTGPGNLLLDAWIYKAGS